MINENIIVTQAKYLEAEQGLSQQEALDQAIRNEFGLAEGADFSQFVDQQAYADLEQALQQAPEAYANDDAMNTEAPNATAVRDITEDQAQNEVAYSPSRPQDTEFATEDRAVQVGDTENAFMEESAKLAQNQQQNKQQ